MTLSPNVLKGIRENLDKAEVLFVSLTETISDARRAGIDTTSMEKDATELRQQISRMRSVYGA